MKGNRELNPLVAEVGEEILAENPEASTEEDIELVGFVCAHLLWALAHRANSGDQEAEERFADAVAEIDRALEEAERRRETNAE